MNLLKDLTRFPQVIKEAAEKYEPFMIARFAVSVAQHFNKFYHETKILAEEDEEKKKGYLALLTLAKKVLETCIDLLGFTAPERM